MAFINTVPSKDQLAENLWVSFNMGDDNTAKRIIFIGNSITRHGVAEHIGWTHDWGMAASDISKDYVHLTAAALEKKLGKIDFCVTQAADWERNYTDKELLVRQYNDARNFCADYVVLRIGENVIRETFDYDKFVEAYVDMAHFFASKEGAKIVMTDLMWNNNEIDGKLNDAIHEAAKRLNLDVIEMNDLGKDDKYAAKGLFWHEGVAGHPGDFGMQTISDRIVKALGF